MGFLRDDLRSFSFRGDKVPPSMHEQIENYIKHGVAPGEFLTAVMTNDLKGAVTHADDTNLRLLHVFFSFFYNKTPYICWGSSAKVKNWIERKGLSGGVE